MENTNRILIAEDDAFLSKIVSNRLKEEGFDVDNAYDGQEAMEKLNESVYNLMMLDLIMPIKSGFEILEQMKRDFCKIPVLVFTNLSQEEDKESVLSLGAQAFYVKSDITIDELVNVIKNFIAGRSTISK